MSHSGQHIWHPLWKEERNALLSWHVFTDFFFFFPPALQKVIPITHEEVSKDVHKQEAMVKKTRVQRYVTWMTKRSNLSGQSLCLLSFFFFSPEKIHPFGEFRWHLFFGMCGKIAHFTAMQEVCIFWKMSHESCLCKQKRPYAPAAL